MKIKSTTNRAKISLCHRYNENFLQGRIPLHLSLRLFPFTILVKPSPGEKKLEKITGTGIYERGYALFFDPTGAITQSASYYRHRRSLV